MGRHSRPGDLPLNVTKRKQLTNFRADGKDDAVRLIPPVDVTLDFAIEYIADDELIEVTPKTIRLRKKILDTESRQKATKRKKEQLETA